MKIGIIFKKAWHDKYGKKQEFVGDFINLTRKLDWLHIKYGDYRATTEQTFRLDAIQLIYFGDWK